MTTPFNFLSEISLMGPEVFTACVALVLLLVGAFGGNKATGYILGLSVLALLIVCGEIATNTALWSRTVLMNGMFVTDSFAAIMKGLCALGLAFALMISARSLRLDHMWRFEYPILLLLSGLGMMFMVSANDFLTLYVGLELSSLSLYVLAAFRRESAISAEAGMKYFILGALSSGLLLFGVSLIYGFGATTNFDHIATLIGGGQNVPPGIIIGMAFVLAGVAFKISAVPFHMWTPDVYQGAPGPVTALFAMVPKIAAFGLLIRLLFVPFVAAMEDTAQIIAFLSLASMIWGSIAAIAQNNVKRLLAYSSIGNIGFALVGVIAGTHNGIAAGVLYLLIYLFTMAGTFGVLLGLRRHGAMVETLDDLAGLSRAHPVLAYVLAIMLFSMAGIPPLAGFFGKFMVFGAVIDQEFYLLAVAGVLASVVAAFYYLNMIRVMFFQNPDEKIDVVMGLRQQFVIVLATVFVLGFVLFPDPLLILSHRAAAAFPAALP